VGDGRQGGGDRPWHHQLRRRRLHQVLGAPRCPDRQALINPESTFFSVKRFIGRNMAEFDNEAKQVSYGVLRDDYRNVKLDCPAIGRQFAAEEISAQVELDLSP
jgi:hypothetical protein